MAKLLKENKNIFVRAINDFLKMSPGLKRLLTPICALIIITHIGACLWYLLKFNLLVIL